MRTTLKKYLPVRDKVQHLLCKVST